MAIKKNISVSGKTYIATGFGPIEGEETTISFDTYIKVNAVSATKDKAIAFVWYYDDKEESEKKVVMSKEFEFALDLEGGNPITQAYNHLRALPEFSDAIDC